MAHGEYVMQPGRLDNQSSALEHFMAPIRGVACDEERGRPGDAGKGGSQDETALCWSQLSREKVSHRRAGVWLLPGFGLKADAGAQLYPCNRDNLPHRPELRNTRVPRDGCSEPFRPAVAKCSGAHGHSHIDNCRDMPRCRARRRARRK